MEDGVISASKITNSTGNSRMKVHVLEKWSPRIARTSSRRYQKLILPNSKINACSLHFMGSFHNKSR
ncbi:hypothetical protein ACSBR1_013005 [Camellia fascicularis]